MSELSLNPRFLQDLILRTRAALAQDGQETDEEGNPADSATPVGRRVRDLSDDTLMMAIDDLEPDQRAELLALFWIGRGDMEPEEWDDAVQLGLERDTGSTAEYLLSHPHLAEHWDDALDRIFDGSGVVEDGEF